MKYSKSEYKNKRVLLIDPPEIFYKLIHEILFLVATESFLRLLKCAHSEILLLASSASPMLLCLGWWWCSFLLCGCLQDLLQVLKCKHSSSFFFLLQSCIHCQETFKLLSSLSILPCFPTWILHKTFENHKMSSDKKYPSDITL